MNPVPDGMTGINFILSDVLLERAEKLKPYIATLPDLLRLNAQASRTQVLRLAVEIGLDEMERRAKASK